jgi:hypothetical protein
LGLDDIAPYQAQAVSHGSQLEPAEVPPVKIKGRMLDPEAAARHIAAEVEAVAKAAPDPVAIEAAVQRRNEADQGLANRRVELLAEQSAERVACDKLAQAVMTFQKGFPPMTPEELRRSHVREQHAIRAAGITPHRSLGIGKSVIDRTAYYERHGGGPATGNRRRGAYPSQAKGALNYDPRRGNVAAPPVTPQIVVK